MISNDLTQIVLLNPVKINYHLSKWRQEGESDQALGSGVGMMMQSGGTDNWPPNANIWDGVNFITQREFRSPFWKKVADSYIRFRLLFTKPKKDPVKFFMELKENFSDLEKAEIDENKMQGMLSNLEKTKQKYAIATLINEKITKEIENKLFDAGYIQHQTEESLIKFIKQCKKGLCLTEIEYFDKVIPEDVMDKFFKAEDTKLFDNYYILYYDPKNTKNIFYTAVEKDPIMFGVIRGSKKLFLIADWIDDYCNLTYKDILDQGVDYKLNKQE